MNTDPDCAFVLTLIESIENKKCIYDKRDPFYFNRSIKERAWKEIGEICSKSGADCRHRWKLLRERFCKELKKLDAPSGSGMEPMEWRFFQPMQFLKDFLGPSRIRHKVDNIETDTEEVTFSGESLVEIIYPTPTPPREIKPTLDSLCQKFAETMENVETGLGTLLEQGETSDEWFMKTMVSLMKDLPLDVKDDFQARFIQELYRIRKNCRERKRGRPKTTDGCESPITDPGSPTSSAASTCSKKYKFSQTPPNSKRYDQNSHWVVFREKGSCRLCQTGTPLSKCLKCGVHLCCNSEKNCFLSFHT